KEAITASPVAAIIGGSRLILSCQARTNLVPTSRPGVSWRAVEGRSFRTIPIPVAAVPAPLRKSPFFGCRLDYVAKTQAGGFGRFARQGFYSLCSERGCFSFSLVPQKPFIRPAGMLCGVSFSCPLHSALRASRVGDTSPAACCPAGKAGKASPFNQGEDP